MREERGCGGVFGFASTGGLPSSVQFKSEQVEPSHFGAASVVTDELGLEGIKDELGLEGIKGVVRDGVVYGTLVVGN